MMSADAEVAQLAGQRAAEAVAILRILQQRTSAGTVWSSEDPSIVTPDLWVGFLGPAVSVALHSGGVGHTVISPQWLRRCARF